jgi:hypothetical protein
MSLPFKRLLLLLGMVFQLTMLSAQVKWKPGKYRLSNTNPTSLCGSTIWLEPNGVFFAERGCESRSHITRGRFSIKRGGWINFMADSTSGIRFTSSIRDTSTQASWLEFVDENGILLSNWDIEFASQDIPNNIFFTPLTPSSPGKWQLPSNDSLITVRFKLENNFIDVDPVFRSTFLMTMQPGKVHRWQFNYPIALLQYRYMFSGMSMPKKIRVASMNQLVEPAPLKRWIRVQQ